MWIVLFCGLLFVALYCVHGHNDDVVFLPNERTTLDDCHLRFHRLQPRGFVAPAAGFPALLKEFAHMGAIGWTQPDGNILWKCGGTLIWLDTVLTAAHCVLDANNKEPDVVRFGDLNIETSEGDKFAQQLKIVEIFRHPQHRFSAHYHDIALLKLEHPVELSDIVTPACLWTDEEVRFKVLEATGWGRTGYVENQTPILLKVALKPMENEECSRVYLNGTDRKLKLGLQSHQICAVDEKMDTCEGDSGGPLQVKLLHNGRMTPFIVGITSFGAACGMSTPGVYTRVSSYIDWIVETMQKSGAMVTEDTYNATFCALSFAPFREFDEAMIVSRTATDVNLNYERAHMSTIYELPSYLAQLVWNGDTNDCYGVIIDENTVITLAQCVTKNGIPVSHIRHLNDNALEVSRVHVHPKYKHESSSNNIAILRLKHLLNILDLQPACIWHEETPSREVHVYGSGRTDINNILFEGSEIYSLDPSLSILTPRLHFQNASSCIIPKQYQPLLRDGLTDEYICTGEHLFLVPKSCELLTGAAVHNEVNRGNIYPMVYGLNYLSRDCGFGEHSIAIGTASHVGWMKSVLLPNGQKSHGTVQFVDSDRHEGDSCRRYDGRAARCTPISNCSRGWKQFLSNGTIELCDTSSLVCCPLSDIVNSDNSVVHPVLQECPTLVKDLKPTSSAGSLVYIAWLTEDIVEFRCLGTIITDRIILTTASCVGTEVPTGVQLPANTSQNMYRVNTTVLHPAYKANDHINDIALIQLEDTLVWSSDLYPSCLWTNTTHVPLVLSMISPIAQNISRSADHTDQNLNITAIPEEAEYTRVLSMYNSDCQRTHEHEVLDTQLCARNPFESITCGTFLDQLQFINADKVPFVVGLSTNFSDCSNTYFKLFTRISGFVNWIGMYI
ncbi:uncharacterized protein LOC129778038 [Toxorhynchites rutilus septentrionalis]|uniref:uncharacterized protein LOC129778038 n=1 Tax=Toxorhynchites rutilus septentrionalis TaxID=329112 RepID=UPI002479EC93|nr:uncharacterized protein LOC129778038 [Toxorhynchites rutilus septentrionalis]